MKKLHFLPVLACFTGMALFSHAAEAQRKAPGRHWVRTYTRKDGTTVQGHWAGSGSVLPDNAPGASSGGTSGPPLNAQSGPAFDRTPQQATRMEQSWVTQQRLNREVAAGGHIDESGQWVPARRVVTLAAKPALSPFSGQCVGVTDGDTIKVLHGGAAETIRLNAIDAPEKKQDFGEVSKQSLSKLAFGQNITVYPSARDRYGRTLAWVFVGKNNLNAAQVQSGLAWWYREYAPKEAKIGALEGQARAAKIGLWRDAAPVAPWLFRKAKKAK